MKKTAMILAAVLMTAGMAMAQPGPMPNCPQAPNAPMGMGPHGHGMMMQGGPGCGMGHQSGMRHGGHGMGGEARILAMREELGLSDEQVQKIEQMRTDHQMEMIDRRADMEKARLELGNLMRDEAPQGDVNAAIDRVAELRAEMQKAQYAHRQQCMSVLTKEQQAKLEQMRAERREQRQELRQQMRQDKPRFQGRRFGSSN